MLRVCTSVCLAAGMTTATAFAEAQMDRLLSRGSPGARDVTVTGCVAPSAQPNAYTLAVISQSDPPTSASGVLAPGTPLRLVGLPPEDFQEYVGQQVEVFGMVRSRGSSGRRRSTAADASTKITVRSIRQLAASCAAPAPSTTPTAVVSTAGPGSRRDSSRGRGSRAASVAAPAPRPATAPGATTPLATSTTPGWPAGSTPPASAPGVSTPPAAPASNTTTNATSGQSGMSGSATLGGTIAMTPPVITFPIGGSPSSAAGTTQPTAPSPTAGVSQGASNTTTSNAALDQFGLTGDAILSGLVNVNIQQLLASVQLIANINVQDVVVNVSDILNDNQIQALVQALNTNPQAALNANDLTSALQQAGVLDPSQWVVGVTGSQIYENRSLTTALQERGIIQPGETIMGTATPHVYVLGGK